MLGGKEKLVPLTAVFLLVVGVSSSVYVYATQQQSKQLVETNAIMINGEQFDIDELFQHCKQIEVEKKGKTYAGIALDDVIIKAGVENPGIYDYRIRASDGYQKTVTWENMQTGILTKEKMTVFPDLPGAFMIKDVVEIEVI